MNYISIILARGGSKGIPNKNIQILGKIPLIARAILSCKKSKNIKKVYVSTDNKDIAQISEKYGAMVLKRPAYLSGDNVSSEDGWIYSLKQIYKLNGSLPNETLFVQCTVPFIFPQEIDHCFDTYKKERLDCCFSAKKNYSFLWTYNGKFLKGVNHKEIQPRKRRQNIKNFFKETGAFYLVNTKKFILKKNRFFGKIGLVEVRCSIDIDEKSDLLNAKSQLNSYKNIFK